MIHRTDEGIICDACCIIYVCMYRVIASKKKKEREKKKTIFPNLIESNAKFNIVSKSFPYSLSPLVFLTPLQFI